MDKSDYFKNASAFEKKIFVLGAYEYLKRLECKIRKCLFFYVKIYENNSVELEKY